MKNKLCPNCDVHSFDDKGVCNICEYKYVEVEGNVEKKEVKASKKAKSLTVEGEPNE